MTWGRLERGFVVDQSIGRLSDIVDGNSQQEVASAYERIGKGASPDFRGIENLDCFRTEFEPAMWVPVSGLIVELREHWNLLHVIKRVMRLLKIPVTLVHGSQNRALVESSSYVRKMVSRGKLRLINLGLANLDRRQYSALFLTENFWTFAFPARQVLVFQTDSTICSRSPYSLDTFKDYDYVGSYMPNPRPCGLHIDGGNGGLSLRSLSKTVEAIRIGDPRAWPSAEDDYFGAHIELVGGNVADSITSKKFGSQIEFTFKSLGVHNPGGLNKRQFLKLLAYCPDSIRCHRGTLLGRQIGSMLNPGHFIRRQKGGNH